MAIAAPQDVLAFWFAPGRDALWYARDENFDREIRERFLATYEAACEGRLDEWRQTPQSILALIVVLDQFPRNMFRGLARAFAADPRAVRLTREAINNGFARMLAGAQLDFLYMPLMHSESLSDHELLIEVGHGDNRYAREHYQAIARFGRFPHRNETLGREDTPEEADYLAKRKERQPW